MVATKVFVYVFAFCLVQAIYAETVEQVLAELKPKVFQLSMKATGALIQSAPAIGKARSQTEIKKAQGVVTVRARIGILKASIKKAEIEAHITGKDIEKCLNQANESLSSVNVQEIAKCNAAQEFQKATENLQALKKLKSEINRIPKECLKEVSEEDPAGDLRKCMEAALELGSKAVDESKNNIDASVKAAVDNVNTCVDALVKSGLENLSKISEEFDKCVSEA